MRRRGLSLVEVLLAAALVSAAAVPLVAHLVAESRSTRLGRDAVTAARLASDVVERLRLEPAVRLAAALGGDGGHAFLAADPLLNPPPASSAERAYLGRFERSAWVEADPADEGRALLRVRVSWAEDGRRRHVAAAVVVTEDE